MKSVRGSVRTLGATGALAPPFLICGQPATAGNALLRKCPGIINYRRLICLKTQRYFRISSRP